MPAFKGYSRSNQFPDGLGYRFWDKGFARIYIKLRLFIKLIVRMYCDRQNVQLFAWVFFA